MGAKYLPSIKDLKAAKRFHQQQKQSSKPTAPKSSLPPAGKPAKRSRSG